MLNIHEIFESVQGEASHMGRPCFFVRLQGCSLACYFCDEKKTWKAAQGEDLEPRVILERLRELNPHLPYVTITGGEPCEQNLRALLDLLSRNGFTTAIETSGRGAYASVLLDYPDLWLTLSPKDPYSRTESDPLPDWIWARASEVKFLVSGLEGSKYLEQKILAKTPPQTPIFLQPDFFDFESSRDMALALCRKYPQRLKLGLQAHKYWALA